MNIVLAILLSFFSQSFQSNIIEEESEFTIVVNNIEEIKGRILIGIFEKEEDYPKEDRMFRALAIKVDANAVSGSVSVPKGEYAVALFHDENDDEICNTNWIGIPREAFGFSNNIRPFFSLPAFDKVKVNVVQDKKIEISLMRIF